MNSLFICHSAGDSHALMATAKALIKKNNDHKIIFFIVGNTAIKQLNAVLASDPSLNANIISHTIDASLIAKAESAALTANDFEIVKTELNQLIEKYEITNALVGTPSLNQASLPFQMAEYLTTYFNDDHLFIYNDYLFKEKNHCYWNMLEQDWAGKITHLVPFPATENAINHIRPFLKIQIVGHPAVDIILSKSTTNKKAIREALAVDEKQSLIFISGSKDIVQDKELLWVLLQEKECDAEFELRLGIHPGIADINAYITEILDLVHGTFPNRFQQVKLLIHPALQGQLKLPNEYKDNLCPSSLRSEEITSAADGLVSTVPATLFNQALVQGKPAYCHDADNVSYLPSERAFQGKEKLSSFLFTLKKKETPKPMTRTEMGLAENEIFVEKMVKLLS